MSKDALEHKIRQVLRTDRVPPFEELWSEALTLNATETKLSPAPRRRLVAVAVIGMLSIAGVGILLLIGPSPSDQTEKLSSVVKTSDTLSRLHDLSPWEPLLDGFDMEWNLEFALVNFEDISPEVKPDLDGTAVDYADETYELPTDFLLTMDIPVWNKTEERSPR